MLRTTKLFTFLFLASCATAATVDAQSSVVAPVASPAIAPIVTPAGANDCGCTTGCSTSMGDCGRSGAMFGRRQACGDCGDCGAAGCSGGCVTGQLGRGGGSLMDRVKDFVFPSDGCGGRYRSFFGGWSDMQDYNGNVAGAGPLSGTFNDGFLLGTARGRYLNENLRLEWESNWRNNSGDDWTSGMGVGPLDGQFNMFSTMINTVREFGNGRIRPYAGAGIGLGIQDGDFSANGNVFRLDDWAFAYQGILGMNLKQSDRNDFYFEYRYYGNGTTRLEQNGVEIDDFTFNSENIVFGIRIKR